MPIDRLRRLAPQFQQAAAVVLSGWGEPLSYAHLEEAVRLVAQAGARPGFVTSGPGLTIERAAALVEAGLDFLGFSLAGATAAVHESIRTGSSFDELKEAIRGVSEARAQRGNDRPGIHLVFLLLRDNLESLPALPALARELGVPEVVLTHEVLVANHWQESQRVFSCVKAHRELQGADTLLQTVEDAAKKLQVRLQRPPLLPTWPAICAENPLANLYVSVEGRVSPCVYLQPPVDTGAEKLFCGKRQPLATLEVGSVDEQTLESIWATGAYREFRESFRKRIQRVSRFPAFGGWRPGQDVRSLPPPPCRSCHKILGF